MNSLFMEQKLLQISKYYHSSAHSALGQEAHKGARSSIDTPEPSDEALEQLMITVMKHSLNLMLLCGVPLVYGRPWSIGKMPKFCDNVTAYHD
jgi:hypothetical protein